MIIGSKGMIPLTVLFLSLTSASTALAAEGDTVNNVIQGGHSGTWFDSTQPGHGLFLEVLADETSPTGKEILAAWFAYFDGAQVWLLAQGDVTEIEGGQEALLDVSIYEGNDFPPRYDPEMTVRSDWGTILVSFTGCNEGHLEWDSEIQGFGTGELQLQRATMVAGSFCDPALGGEEELDDHGDTWPAGTFLADLGFFTKEIDGVLETGGDVDVFVFSLSSREAFKAYTLGPTETDTVGTLYEIVGGDELLIEKSDLNPLDQGFEIEEVLDAGDYSLHVTGKKDSTRGPYRLYYEAK